MIIYPTKEGRDEILLRVLKKKHTQRSGIIQAHEQQEKDAAHRSKRPEMKQKINFPMLGKLQEDWDLCTDSLTCESKGLKVIHRQEWQTRLLEKLHVGESDVMWCLIRYLRCQCYWSENWGAVDYIQIVLLQVASDDGNGFSVGPCWLVNQW